ncbi:MAG: hypothetical protein V4727_05425 [Verrucomicrobiota bacterium]
MFENPEWFIDFDHNPKTAIATRKKSLRKSLQPENASTASIFLGPA